MSERKQLAYIWAVEPERPMNICWRYSDGQSASGGARTITECLKELYYMSKINGANVLEIRFEPAPVREEPRSSKSGGIDE